MEKIWRLQQLSVLLTAILICGFLYWNYQLLDQSKVSCHSAPFSAWTYHYSFPVIGASFSTFCAQVFRYFLASSRAPVEGSHHAFGNQLVITIAAVQTVSISLSVYGWGAAERYSCVDFLGVYITPVLALEWLITIPAMFFLVSTIDVKKTELVPHDKYFLALSAGSVFVFVLLLFIGDRSGNISTVKNGLFLQQPRALFTNSFVVSLVLHFLALLMICSALYMQYSVASDALRACKQETDKIPVVHRSDYAHVVTMDRLRCAEYQFRASNFMILSFSAFPLLYAFTATGLLTQDIYIVVLQAISCLTKILFFQIMDGAYFKILGEAQVLLAQERNRAEQSRIAFLRYVFHDVRVPLNTLSLGIELLGNDLTNDIEIYEQKQKQYQLYSDDHSSMCDEASIKSSRDYSELSNLPARLHSKQETIGMMQEAAKFMGDTLDDILSLQRIEDGKLNLEMKWFPPECILKNVTSNLRSQYETKHITLYVDVRDNVPLNIYADQFRLEHVLSNLLSNAIKFSDEHSAIHLTVCFATLRNDFITFTVRDHGAGMSKEEQNALFQPFVQFRAGETQKGRGSGLGLSICKSIISQHHGFLTVESTLRPSVASSDAFSHTVHVDTVEAAVAPSSHNLSVDTDTDTELICGEDSRNQQQEQANALRKLRWEKAVGGSSFSMSLAVKPESRDAKTKEGGSIDVCGDERTSDNVKNNDATAAKGRSESKSKTFIESGDSKADQLGNPTISKAAHEQGTQDTGISLSPLKPLIPSKAAATLAEEQSSDGDIPVEYIPVLKSLLTVRSFPGQIISVQLPVSHSSSKTTPNDSSSKSVSSGKTSSINTSGPPSPLKPTLSPVCTGRSTLTSAVHSTLKKKSLQSQLPTTISIPPLQCTNEEVARIDCFGANGEYSRSSGNCDGDAVSVRTPTYTASPAPYCQLGSVRSQRQLQLNQPALTPYTEEVEVMSAADCSTRTEDTVGDVGIRAYYTDSGVSDKITAIGCESTSSVTTATNLTVMGLRARSESTGMLPINGSSSTTTAEFTDEVATRPTLPTKLTDTDTGLADAKVATTMRTDISHIANRETSVNGRDRPDRSAASSIRRTMICDDVPSNRKLLGMVLRQRGLVQCEYCVDGLHALETVQEMGLDYFDLIFMDALMPNLNGPDATRELRRIGYGNLIVGVTGCALTEEVEEFEDAGADAVFKKPLKMEALSSLISYCNAHGVKSPMSTDVPMDQRLKAWVQREATTSM